MDNIAEYQARITAALDRISSALPKVGAEDQGLADALEAERTANAQLEERVKAIKDKQETMVTELEAQVSSLKQQVDEQDTALGELRAAVETKESEARQLRKVTAELRARIAALREANAAALPDAHLVNKAMASELEALRAAETSMRAEMDEILGALEPIVTEAEHA